MKTPAIITTFLLLVLTGCSDTFYWIDPYEGIEQQPIEQVQEVPLYDFQEEDEEESHGFFHWVNPLNWSNPFSSEEEFQEQPEPYYYQEPIYDYYVEEQEEEPRGYFSWISPLNWTNPFSSEERPKPEHTYSSGVSVQEESTGMFYWVNPINFDNLFKVSPEQEELVANDPIQYETVPPPVPPRSTESEYFNYTHGYYGDGFWNINCNFQIRTWIASPQEIRAALFKDWLSQEEQLYYQQYPAIKIALTDCTPTDQFYVFERGLEGELFPLELPSWPITAFHLSEAIVPLDVRPGEPVEIVVVSADEREAASAKVIARPLDISDGPRRRAWLEMLDPSGSRYRVHFEDFEPYEQVQIQVKTNTQTNTHYIDLSPRGKGTTIITTGLDCYSTNQSVVEISGTRSDKILYIKIE